MDTALSDQHAESYVHSVPLVQFVPPTQLSISVCWFMHTPESGICTARWRPTKLQGCPSVQHDCPLQPNMWRLLDIFSFGGYVHMHKLAQTSSLFIAAGVPWSTGKTHRCKVPDLSLQPSPNPNLNPNQGLGKGQLRLIR